MHLFIEAEDWGQGHQHIQEGTKWMPSVLLTDIFKLMTWWHHQMKTFSELLAFCEGNLLVTGGFPSQRPVTRSFDLHLNKWLSKQLGRRWVETPSHSLWCHFNVNELIDPWEIWMKLVSLDIIDDESTLSQVMAGAIRQYAITWANVDPDLFCHTTSPGHSELM